MLLCPESWLSAHFADSAPLHLAHEPTAGIGEVHLSPVRLKCCGEQTGSFQVMEARSSRSYSLSDASFAPNWRHSI